MDDLHVYKMIRYGALAFTLAAAVCAWWVAQPSWEMVVDVANGDMVDPATSAMLLVAFTFIILYLAKPYGRLPTPVSKTERWLMVVGCGAVVALTCKLVEPVLSVEPLGLSILSLPGAVAICLLMGLYARRKILAPPAR